MPPDGSSGASGARLERRVRSDDRERGRGSQELLRRRGDDRRVGRVGRDRAARRVDGEARVGTGHGLVELGLQPLRADEVDERLGYAPR